MDRVIAPFREEWWLAPLRRKLCTLYLTVSASYGLSWIGMKRALVSYREWPVSISPHPPQASMDTIARYAPKPRHAAASQWDTIHTVHALAAVSVLGIGAFVLTMRKGTKTHRVLGRVWAGAMLTTCVSSFGIRDTTGNFSWIHGLSVFTIYKIGAGVYHIRHNNLRSHARCMKGSYIGALVAGAFAVFTPGRMLYRDLFGEPQL